MDFKDETERKRIQKMVDVFMTDNIRFVPVPVIGDTQFRMLIAESTTNLIAMSEIESGTENPGN